MRNVFYMLKRELQAYFLTPVAYIILLIFLVLQGLLFSSLIEQARFLRSQEEIMLGFFGANIWFWAALIIIVPTLTMRLFAEEKRSGTLEVLMTSPVTDLQVVLAKYLGALVYYVFLWIPTLFYFAIYTQIANPDPGVLAGGYLGFMLVGALFLSIGVFTSSMTTNQITAAIMSAFIIIVIVAASQFTSSLEQEHEWVKNTISYTMVFSHFHYLAKGIIPLRILVFYFSATAFFIFLTVKVVESRKWR